MAAGMRQARRSRQALELHYHTSERTVITIDVAAIITGILSILAGVPAGRRALAILSGAGSALYGGYVLNQDSGTWYFPLYLFLLPLFTAGSAASANLRDH